MKPLGWNMTSEGYPWDYRIEYIQCDGMNNYFTLFYQIEKFGTQEELSIIVSVDNYTSQDKKLTGCQFYFCVACHGGNWRNSGVLGWGYNNSSTISGRLKKRWTVSTLVGGYDSDPDTGEIYGAIAPLPDGWTLNDDVFNRCTVPQDGMYAKAWGEDWCCGPYNKPMWMALPFGILTQFYELPNNPFSETPDVPLKPEQISSYDRTPFKIYDFYRKVRGKPDVHLIPCVMKGVVGMYDEVNKRFYSSVTNVSFGEGPKIADNDGYKVL